MEFTSSNISPLAAELGSLPNLSPAAERSYIADYDQALADYGEDSIYTLGPREGKNGWTRVVYNLVRNGVKTLEDLERKSDQELFKFRKMGPRSIPMVSLAKDEAAARLEKFRAEFSHAKEEAAALHGDDSIFRLLEESTHGPKATRTALKLYKLGIKTVSQAAMSYLELFSSLPQKS